MAYVEVVIKIPEEVKNRLCFGITYQKDIQAVCEALNDGIPLPKGHGKIVDANRVLENGDNWEVETALMQTEAIIEADNIESGELERQATEFLAEARGCAESEDDE